MNITPRVSVSLLMLLPVHIIAGGLAILLGGVALAVSKGATLHRRSGLLFVFAMLVMGISGSSLALRQSLTNANVTGGLMSCYFVVTGLTSVRAPSVTNLWLNRIALIVATLLALVDLTLGFQALAGDGSTSTGVPYFMCFFLAAILTLAAIGDIRIMRFGSLKGPRRLARHLWRMCFALFIAAGSFFSIRSRVAKILPDPFTTPLFRALPMVVILVAMFYWLWRVRARRPIVRPDAVTR